MCYAAEFTGVWFCSSSYKQVAAVKSGCIGVYRQYKTCNHEVRTVCVCPVHVTLVDKELSYQRDSARYGCRGPQPIVSNLT